MKSVALSVWIFINLVCFGMCGYFYLIWSQYWMNLERQRLFSKTVLKLEREKIPEVFYYGPNAALDISKGFKPLRLNVTVTDSPAQLLYNKNKARRDTINISNNQDKYLRLERTKKQINVIKRNGGRPRFPNLGRPFVELDTKKYQCDVENPDTCAERVEEYKTLILKEFKRILMDEGNILKAGTIANPYNVQFDPTKHGNFREKSAKELMCELKSKYVRTITGVDSPFAALGFGKRIPSLPLLRNNFYNSCAIVASSGSLAGSNLGDFIDSHDLVLRFNHAPTKNYSQDVGAKTTIRVVNSQVVTKKEFRFQASPLYKNVSLLAWDPSNYTSTLFDWFRRPDFDMFPEYKRFMRRNPRADFHMLNPRSLWELWDFVQANSPNRLRRNPPSSGFLGLSVLLPRCSFVDVFEYIPSARLTGRCHYYDKKDDPACTFGVWHPLAAEKTIAYRLNSATDFTVFQAGYLRIQGYQHLDC